MEVYLEFEKPQSEGEKMEAKKGGENMKTVGKCLPYYEVLLKGKVGNNWHAVIGVVWKCRECGAARKTRVGMHSHLTKRHNWR